MPYSSMLNPRGLKVLTGNYLHGVDLSPIDKAWEVVTRVHSGKTHYSGEPYLIHLLEVASTLASMHLDFDTVLAGLLHGVLKEGVELEDLKREFGPGVAAIVAGSSKINKVQYNSKLVNQAENVRKMLLAIAADIRVLLLKLIDRLQDMLSLDRADRETQHDIALETMDLYAPLASRLGIDWLKRELEDHSFRYLYPEEYNDINTRLESSLQERQEYVDEVITILHKKLAESGISPIRIIGRPKHIYSIYKKLIAQNIPLERVYDKVAFRIIVETVKECYEALGTIHANWSPVPGRIKDFISVPKANNYQSMHTTVVGPREHFIEIQIRTDQMDRVAQEGVAAHWAYKEGQQVSDRDARLFRELKNLVKSLQEVEDPREFLDSVKGELYDPDVYALTPAGDVKEFPQGSCPIDFAYSIHTQVGDHCVGAKVNGRLVQLKYQLQNGDIIEIITSPTQTPRRGWLDLVKTSRAKARIRSWLRRDEKEKALKLGREICEREIKSHDTTLKKMIKSGHIRLLLKELRCNSLEDMLVKVGSGVITVQTLVRALQPPEIVQEQEAKAADVTPEELAATLLQPPAKGDDNRGGISIAGVDGMLIKISRCCSPLPGDPIVGFITQGRGVSIHKQDCINLKSTDPHRWIDVSWSGIEDKHYKVSIHIRSENRRGIFAEISAVISSDNANIVDLSGHTTPDDTADLNITMEVRDLEHLQVILQHLRQMEHVISVRRV
ncbi:RelA/SpoT family protein [Desulfopila aestuarii]|uniref:GTP pyrophosphokinase n=1 Tax=Desulfopila aestuarii DSM 18488 TaxID=1121416 RepID=A0A1M7Y010_9BACT|nr:bifunctional (p)ppGpp synthetase/guanosine-3',5'-bis(diphosphate) 3'-pyrophosphohydrolase [Desulfopila aestuarii]SHO44869.1 GTP pyrophosphokinase [Desulfopila aestuarii DSM 18488]